ncbi:MAG TPA: UvrD-helicase domain-containing protein, partial [Pusillimonas sp.]|uniref:UvrD-helicase domain-containing protein n=1 Tax=Pusillimonas sp. TaxID=3040095 RepID=UPI002B7FDA82
RSAPVGGYQPEQLAVLNDLIQVLWLATAQLKVRFAQQKEVDFVEISQSALHALGHADHPSELLLKLDASIRHLLVDEFQDTSQSQIRLLTSLTAGWEPDDGRTVFLVGDPMQSVYRFRKAEVGLFLSVRDHGLGQIPLNSLQLTDNFRSQANIVNWVNSMFGPLFPKVADPGMGAIPYTASEPYHAAVPEVGVELHPVWVHASLDSGSAVRTAEAIAVSLARDALSRHAESDHPVAILVRARGHLEGVVRRLSSQGIPCRAVELSPLKSRPAVNDAVQLARALSHPADRLAWLSVLRSPLCGLTLNSLHELFGADHYAGPRDILKNWLREPDAALSHDEAIRLRHACAVLLDESNASGVVPFAAWLQQCWERLGGPAVYFAASDRTDVESLFRLVEKLAPYGGLDPADLEARLDQLYAAPEGAGRAVEVMTIHKSKGLQFESVILMGMHRRPRADTQPLLRLEHSEERLLLGPIKHRSSDTADPVSVYLAEREKERAAYEADRLLYVAVTRACQELHLVGEVALDDDGAVKAPNGSSLLGRLWPHLKHPEPPPLDELLAGEPALEGRHAVPPLWRMQVQSLPDHGSDPQPSVPASPWQWAPDTTHEAAVGTVAHAWLERLGRDGITSWTVERLRQSTPILRKQLGRAGLPAASLDDAAAVVCDTLCATISSRRGQWLLGAARAYREWSLIDATGRVSVIDLAISDEEGWLVVDYKTGTPWQDESQEAFAARMRQRHGAQLQRYCDQVRALDGRPARAALYFPRADIWLEC